MRPEWVRVEREELYEMVWQKPITELAEKYGLSYGEMRSICTRMNIYSGSDLADWVAWAHRQADRVDPLVESPHSILDERFR